MIGAGSTPSRSGCRPPCARSRSRSLTSPAPRPSSRADSGLRRSDAALRAPEHETLWGLSGARTRSRVFAAGSVLVEVVQYLEPAGRSARRRLPDLGSGHRQHRLRLASRRAHRELYRRACAAGARPNCRPVHLPGGGVVYVNDPDGFSVELLWMSPASEQVLGIHAAPARQAAAGRHARRRADGPDRGARGDDVGCDHSAREPARVAWSRSVSAAPSKAPRRPMAAAPSAWCGLRARASPNEWSPMNRRPSTGTT